MTPPVEREVARLTELVDAAWAASPCGADRGAGTASASARCWRWAAGGRPTPVGSCSPRAGPSSSAFPFGVVRELFEAVVADSARAEQALAGAAAPAAPVFGAPDGDGDVSFAALHGLLWVALNLAAERPLVLAVDALHWCDRPSLRFLA